MKHKVEVDRTEINALRYVHGNYVWWWWCALFTDCRVSAKDASFELRLHLIYLMNDILHHWFVFALLLSLSNLFYNFISSLWMNGPFASWLVCIREAQLCPDIPGISVYGGAGRRTRSFANSEPQIIVWGRPSLKAQPAFAFSISGDHYHHLVGTLGLAAYAQTVWPRATKFGMITWGVACF